MEGLDYQNLGLHLQAYHCDSKEEGDYFFSIHC